MFQWLEERRYAIAVVITLAMVASLFLLAAPSNRSSDLRPAKFSSELFGDDCNLQLIRSSLKSASNATLLSKHDNLDEASNHPSDLIVMGNELIHAGRFGDAEKVLLRALERGKEEYEEGSEDYYLAQASARENLAILYSNVGRLEEAREIFVEVREYKTKIREYGTKSGIRTWETHAVASQNIAWAEAQLGNYAEAERILEKVHSGFVFGLGYEHYYTRVSGESLAEVYMLTGRHNLASQLLEKVTENYVCPQGDELLGALTAYEMLADSYAQTGEQDKARALTAQVFLARNYVISDHHPHLASSYESISEIVGADPANLSSAIYFLKMAVNNLQGVRQNMTDASKVSRQGFGDEWQETYLKLQALLVDAGRFAEAEQVGRMLKESEYTAFVRGANGSSQNEGLALNANERDWDAQIESWKATPNKLASERSMLIDKRAKGTLSALEEKKLVDLNAAHAANYDDFFAYVADWTSDVKSLDNDAVAAEARDLALEQSRSVRRIVSGIGPDVAMLQAVAFEDSLHLFFITGEAFEHTEVNVTRSELFRTIADARDEIDQAKYYDFSGDKDRARQLRKPLGQLYQYLIAPIEDELEAAGTNTLMLNLQGQIRYLPFAALWDGESYLTQRYQLAVYTPAPNTRYEKPAKLTRAKGFGLSVKTEGFSPLPSVPLELEYIIGSEQRPGVMEGDYVLNDGFTKASFEEGLNEPAPVLHLATHFQIKPGDEAASFLVLGDGSRVSIAAINRSFRYNFEGVELLTLSACETAIGAQSTGLELEGFASLAQNKGAGSVMATLWQVEDTSTPEFMRSFYAGMVKDDLSKAKALQRAQIQMIKSRKYAEPFYWAPFVIMGNWR